MYTKFRSAFSVFVHPTTKTTYTHKPIVEVKSDTKIEPVTEVKEEFSNNDSILIARIKAGDIGNVVFECDENVTPLILPDVDNIEKVIDAPCVEKKNIYCGIMSLSYQYRLKYNLKRGSVPLVLLDKFVDYSTLLCDVFRDTDTKGENKLLVTICKYVASFLDGYARYDASLPLYEMLLSTGDLSMNYKIGMNRVKFYQERTSEYKTIIQYFEKIPVNDEHYADAQYQIAMQYKRLIDDEDEYGQVVNDYYELFMKHMKCARSYYSTDKERNDCKWEITKVKDHIKYLHKEMVPTFQAPIDTQKQLSDMMNQITLLTNQVVELTKQVVVLTQSGTKKSPEERKESVLKDTTKEDTDAVLDTFVLATGHTFGDITSSESVDVTFSSV